MVYILLAIMCLYERQAVFWVREQQRHRPACTFVQTDQHLCYLLFGKYHIQTFYKQNFAFPSCFCS